MVPQGVAFAAIAGMPPQYGLYAAMIPTIMAALFGSVPAPGLGAYYSRLYCDFLGPQWFGNTRLHRNT